MTSQKIEVADAYRSLSIICDSFTRMEVGQKVNYSFFLIVLSCDCFLQYFDLYQTFIELKKQMQMYDVKGIF